MAKIKPSDLTKEEKFYTTQEFFNLVINLESKDDLMDFFLGLLTPSEALMFGRRIKVANRLLAGDTYYEIREKLGVGNSLISTTELWMSSRDDKYRKVLKSHIETDNKPRNRHNEYRPGSQLDVYPEWRITKSVFGIK